MSREHEAALVERARAGDKVALGELIHQAQQLTYGLALRMIPDPTEAQDLTQEVLIRVVTGLAKFRGESSFKTWVYRVASNHLLTGLIQTVARTASKGLNDVCVVAARARAGSELSSDAKQSRKQRGLE